MTQSCFSSHAERVDFFTHEVDLYPVVSSEFCAGRDPLEVIDAIGQGGAKIFQLREKHRFGKELFELALEAREIANRHHMLFLLDDAVDIAVAAGADGVHLGQDDLPIAAARRVSQGLLLGSSTHNIAEALSAEAEYTDYLNIGPIYSTQTKTLSMSALGPAAITEISPLLHTPFTVMGGIKKQHIPELLALGVRRIAMVTEITQAPDIVTQVQTLRQLWKNAANSKKI